MAQLPAHLSKAPVGRERLSREALSELQRERILVAATEVFAKRGYQATTVDNIVSAAKIGVGSFYAHFDGKDDCLLQAYAKIVTEAREQIAAAVPREASWAQQVCAVLHELLAVIVAEPMRARVALVEIQTGGPEALRRYGETLEQAISSMARGRAIAGADPAPPATFEEATTSGLVWLLQQRLARGEADSLRQLHPEMAELILEPYLGAEWTKTEIEKFSATAASDDRPRKSSV